MHKQLQKEGDGRTISSGALASLDAMTDHLIAAIVLNSKHVMGYVRTSAFNDKAAKAAAWAGAERAAAQGGARQRRARRSSCSAPSPRWRRADERYALGSGRVV